MVSQRGNKKSWERYLFINTPRNFRVSHLLTNNIIVCIHLDRYLHACINFCYQSHLGNAQIQGFAINYRSIWSLWVVSRVVSFTVANSGAQIQIQLVGCGSHSSLFSFTSLRLRAILYLQGYFWRITLQFGGVVSLHFIFPGMCIGLIFLSCLFNIKIACNTQVHIVYVLMYFMTEFALILKS